jgi:O-6-methylguanine DNA methyltransferase
MLKKNNKPDTTAFAAAIYSVVSQIPKGSTLSYKEVAQKAGNERGARFVARLMSKNYDPNIPCHRVIYSSGAVGHYNRGGTKAKLALLTAEGWQK